MVYIAVSKSDWFLFSIKVCKSFPLSAVQLIIFMDRILEQPIEKVEFCCLKILDTVFADDIVLFASLNSDFCLFLELFKAEHEVEHWRLYVKVVKVWEHCPWKSFPAKHRSILKKDFFWWGLQQYGQDTRKTS